MPVRSSPASGWRPTEARYHGSRCSWSIGGPFYGSCQQCVVDVSSTIVSKAAIARAEGRALVDGWFDRQDRGALIDTVTAAPYTGEVELVIAETRFRSGGADPFSRQYRGRIPNTRRHEPCLSFLDLRASEPTRNHDSAYQTSSQRFRVRPE